MHMQPYIKSKYYIFKTVESLQKTPELEAESGLLPLGQNWEKILQVFRRNKSLNNSN